MGGPYNIPRNYKGENKILFIFSTKALAYTAGFGVVGFAFKFLFDMIGLSILGLIFVILFAIIGFIIGTFKVPEINTLKFATKTGGEQIDKVILRWIKFKRKNNRIYVYKEEEGIDDVK